MLFRNLLSNSCKYNNTEKIEIIIYNETQSNGYTRIHYQDNGLGIQSSHWLDVFREFTRIKSHDKSVPGTGLGLAICKRVMRLHNGDISISDSNPGGTTFLISFPRNRHTRKKLTKFLER